MEDPLAPTAAAAPGSALSTGGTPMSILCCQCGILIPPNPSNTCPSCLASSSDVTRGISTEATLHQCRGCQRWHHSEGKWIGCDLESRELMSLCLSNVSGLKRREGTGEAVRLVDASWIWTEPHSMRLKIRLTVQKEVQTGTILQQSFIVTFIVRNQQCIECQAAFRQGTWKSLVQVRQRVSHKRTFLYLEQLILKHGAHRGCLSIETFRDGMDFYFPDKGKAARFMSFLEDVVPVKVKSSKKLIGTDDKSNISNFKYTNLIEICPLCKDDLLYLPKKVANNCGNIARLVVVKNISNVIHVIDPLSGQTGQLNAEVYWRDPMSFRPVITAARSRLTRYVVLGKEPVALERNVSRKSTSKRQRNKLALVTTAKESDLGLNDAQYEERSHVGYLLKSGDVCLGYDLTEMQLANDDAETVRAEGGMPDVILVRKLYGGAASTENAVGNKKRIFQLQRLDVDATDTRSAATSHRAARKAKKKDAEMDDVDEEDFLREIEADRDMRANMNLYKSELVVKKKQQRNIVGDEGAEEDVDMKQQGDGNDEEEEEDDDQQVKLDELLDGLVLDGGPDDDAAAAKGGLAGDAWDEMQQQQQPSSAAFLEEGAKAAKDNLTYVGRDDARNVKDKDAAVPVSGNVFGKEFMGKEFKFL